MAAADAKIGVAVSGGRDSLALLLLCAASRPGLIEGATVDHGLRTESLNEAAGVAKLCKTMDIPHSTLKARWDRPPTSNIPAAARKARYDCLSRWAEERTLPFIATAHHLDDQAETILMRLARSSGVSGLAGMAASRPLNASVTLVRPLLRWKRSELRHIVEGARLTAVDDPTNADQRFDRTHARNLLEAADWLDPARIASAASHCRNADEALAWCAAREFEERAEATNAGITIAAGGLPVELQRRLLIIGMKRLGASEPRGPDLIAAVGRLGRGEVTTLGGLKMQGGDRWHLSVAPERRIPTG